MKNTVPSEMMLSSTVLGDLYANSMTRHTANPTVTQPDMASPFIVYEGKVRL